MYSALLCDARARWSRLLGRRVLFTTGTDEHGTKVQEAALANGFQSTIEFCDQVAKAFEDCFRAFGISFDDFVRTTQVGEWVRRYGRFRTGPFSCRRVAVGT